ncbi:MAG: glycosyltransferase family 2 protein [Acutalibacteraceae bacterium]|nr:glycosyltransferase family 2 protein [Acutalibacteraceae bacterium]
MPKPKVSIIIPVYNVEKYIERCVNSLKQQTLTDIEIILVDDSSTDSSLKICKSLAKEDPRIKVITKVNEGAGYARNAALKIAEGEYIGFVDSDDYVEKDMFSTLYKKAEEYGADLVMSGVKFVDGNMFSEQGDCVQKNYFENDTHFETEEELKKLRMGIIGATPDDADDSKYGMSIWKNLFRHEIIKENNLKFESEREMLSEDALFMVDFIACIKKATGIKNAFYNYCRNGDSISKSYKKDRFQKSLVFVKEAQKRFCKDIEENEYRIYIDRFWQAMCRVICSQEIMHAQENGVKYVQLRQRLKAVCTHELTVKTLGSYPIFKLPLKQRVFAYAMKYKLYFLLKLLVGLRSR